MPGRHLRAAIIHDKSQLFGASGRVVSQSLSLYCGCRFESHSLRPFLNRSYPGSGTPHTNLGKMAENPRSGTGSKSTFFSRESYFSCAGLFLRHWLNGFQTNLPARPLKNDDTIVAVGIRGKNQEKNHKAIAPTEAFRP